MPSPFVFLQLLHILAVVVWVGGMFFAHFCLRPAVQVLESQDRLTLMGEVLRRFLGFAGVAACTAVATGSLMVYAVRDVHLQMSGRFVMPVSWTVMGTLGLVMLAIFTFIWLVLFRRLQASLRNRQLAAAARDLGHIREWVSANLLLGGATIACAVLLG